MASSQIIVQCVQACSNVRLLEIHVCKDCYEQIAFYTGKQYKCSKCDGVFATGHALAMHWHFVEESGCDSDSDSDSDPDDNDFFPKVVMKKQKRQPCDIK